MERKKGKVITAISTKGGTGKTIFLLNLAAIYHKLGHKVLVLDLDLYGGAVSLYLNNTNKLNIYNLVEDLANNKYEKIEDYIFKYNENIDIIGSVKDPRTANKIDPKYIPLILNNLAYKYDVVLIDTPSILDDISVITLDNSDEILYTLTNDTFDIKNTKNFITIMKDVGYTNYHIILNESIYLDKNYYSLYDIRNILSNNIDFTISKTMHIKKIDKYLLEGKILLLNENVKVNNTDIEKLTKMAKKLIKKEGDK